MEHPVALVAYNRPEHLKRVLVALWRQRVEPLYIFIDGPKDSADAERVMEVRRLVAGISWTCPTVYARNKNQGLAASICDAVDHVLMRHSTVILLEDDCVPGGFFFPYIYSCLDLYRDVAEIMGVTGYTVPIPQSIRDSYPWDVYFCPRAGSWGWGTWRRAWNTHIRDYEELYKQLDKADIDVTQGGKDVSVYADQVRNAGKDIWTPSWILSVYLAGGQFIYPMISHIQNIGWDSSGTHCGTSDRYATPMATSVPTRFPPSAVFDSRLRDNFRRYYR